MNAWTTSSTSSTTGPNYSFVMDKLSTSKTLSTSVTYNHIDDGNNNEELSSSSNNTSSSVRHRRTLSWSYRRSVKISPTSSKSSEHVEPNLLSSGGKGIAGCGATKNVNKNMKSSNDLSIEPPKDLSSEGFIGSLKRSKSSKGSSWWKRKSRSRTTSPSKEHSPTKEKEKEKKNNKDHGRPQSPRLSFSRPSSPFCTFSSFLPPRSGPPSPVNGPSPPSGTRSPASVGERTSPLSPQPLTSRYKMDSALLWPSTLFSPPSLVIDVDVSIK